MILSLKRLLSHSAIYGVSDVLGRGIAFLLVPIYTNVMTTDEYGNVALVYAFIGLLLPFFAYGMESAFLRFYLLDPSRKQQVLSTGYLTMIATSVVLSGGIYLLAPSIAALISTSTSFDPYVRLAAVVLGLDALNVIPFARLRGEERPKLFATLKLAKVILELSGNIWLVVYLGAGTEGVLISNVIGSGMVCIVLTLLTVRRLTLDWSGQRMRELLKFAVPYIPAGAAVTVIEMIDRFMIERMETTHVVAIYSASRKLGIGLLLFVNVFRLAWQPFFLETSTQEDARAVFSRVLTYFLAIIGGLFLGISLLIDNLVRFPVGGYTFFEKAYWEATDIVPLFLLAYILYGLYVNLMVGIYIEKKTTYLPIITGSAAGLCVLANLILIPRFGMYGAAIASVLAYAAMVTGLYIVAQRHYPIPYEGSRLIKICLACGVIFALGQMEGGVIYKLGLLVCYPLALAAMGFFNAEEIRYVRKIIRNPKSEIRNL